MIRESGYTAGERRFRQASGALYATLVAGKKILTIFRKPVSDAAYRAKAAKAHPDTGGSREAWDELDRAKKLALRDLRGDA